MSSSRRVIPRSSVSSSSLLSTRRRITSFIRSSAPSRFSVGPQNKCHLHFQLRAEVAVSLSDLGDFFGRGESSQCRSDPPRRKTFYTLNTHSFWSGERTEEAGGDDVSDSAMDFFFKHLTGCFLLEVRKSDQLFPLPQAPLCCCESSAPSSLGGHVT